MELIDNVLKIGFVRCSEEGFMPFPKFGYRVNILPPVQSCACDLFQKSSIALLCPITSIIFGFGRLYDIICNKPLQNNEDSQDENVHQKKTKRYFIATGIISAVGLGVFILLIRIISLVIRLIFKAIASILSKLLSKAPLNYYDSDQKNDQNCLLSTYRKLTSLACRFSPPNKMERIY